MTWNLTIEEFDENTVKINEVVSEKRGQRTGNGRKITSTKY